MKNKKFFNINDLQFKSQMDNIYFIRPHEAAKILGCSVRHIYNLIEKNKLKVFKDGIIRIYKSSFYEYLKSHTRERRN